MQGVLALSDGSQRIAASTAVARCVCDSRVDGCAGGAVCWARPCRLSAQYFGRNKVQYEHFDFKVLATEHFDIYYYPEEEAAVATRRAHGRALARAAVQAAAARAARPAAAHPVRGASALPADQHPAGEIGEGTGGVTESANAAASSCRLPAALPKPITCSATSWCTRSSTTWRRRRTCKAGRSARACRRCRCGSSKAWRSTCRSGRSTRTPRCGCATRRRATRCRSIDKLDDPGLLPVSLRPRVLGVRRRALGRSRRRRHAARHRSRRRHRGGDRRACSASTTSTLTTDWHDATRRSFAAVFETAQAAPAHSAAR